MPMKCARNYIYLIVLYVILVTSFNFFVIPLKHLFNLLSKDSPSVISKLIDFWPLRKGRQCKLEMFHEFDNFGAELYPRGPLGFRYPKPRGSTCRRIYF